MTEAGSGGAITVGGAEKAAPRSAHKRPSGESGGNAAQISSSGTPRCTRSSSIWVWVSSIEWLSGSPASGRPNPLMV